MAKNPISIEYKVANASFNSSLKDMQTSVTTLNKEFKLQKEQMKNSSTESEKLETELTKLNKEYDLAQQKTNLTASALKNAKEITGDASEETRKWNDKLLDSQTKQEALKNKIETTNKKLEEAKRAEQGLTEEQQKSIDASEKRKTKLGELEGAQDELKSSSEKLSKEYELQVGSLDKNATESDKLKLKQQHLSAEMENSAKQVDNLEEQLALAKSEYGENSKEVDKLEQELLDAKIAQQQFANEVKETSEELRKAPYEEASKKLGAVGDKMTSVGEGMTKGVTVPVLAAGAAATVAFNEVDGALDTIITKTGATGAAADSLSESFSNVSGSGPYEIQAVGEAIGELNTQFAFTGEELETATTQMLQFANINESDVTTAAQNAKQAIGAFGLESKDLGGVLDTVTAVSQKTGVSVDDIFSKVVTGAPQLKAMGLSFGEGAALIGKFEKAGIDSSSMLSLMSKATVKYAKDGKTLEDGLDGTIKQIKNASSETEALTIASEIFGTKGATKIVDAVKRGELSFDDLSKMASEAAGTVGETFDATLDPIDNATTALNNAKIAGAELGGTIFEVLGPVLESLSNTIKRVTSWFKGLSDTTKKIIVIVAMVVAAIGPLLVVIGTVVSSVGALIPVFTSIAGVITGPILAAIAGAVAGIALLVVGFVLAYKKITPFREFINKIGASIADFAEKVKIVVSAIVDMFQGDWVGGRSLLEGILPEDAILKIENAVISVKLLIHDMAEFFKKQFARIKQFWDENGTQIIQAISNFFSIIWSIVQPALEILKGIFSVGFSLIVNLIKNAWVTIKGVISGALNVIMGIVKIFTGLFTGDFSKMWSGIKQVFSGATKILVSLASGFLGQFKAIFSAGTTIVKNIFSVFVSKIREFFSSLKAKLIEIAKLIWQDIRNRFGNGISTVKNAFSNFVSKIREFFNNLKAKLVEIAQNIWSNLKNRFSDGISLVREIFTNFTSKIKEIFNNLKTKLIDTAKNIWIGVKEKFVSLKDDLVENITSLPEKLKNGLLKGKNALKEGLVEIWKTAVKGAAKPVNKIIDGANWVLKKFGSDKEIAHWEPYAKGTDGHPGGDALVNDGRGAELIQYPDGRTFIPRGKNVLIKNAPVGMKVLPAEQTAQVMGRKNPTFAYAGGIGQFASNLWDGVKSTASKVTNWALDIYDYIENPSKLVSKVVSKFVNYDGIAGLALDIGKSMIGKVKGSMGDWVKGLFETSSPAGPSGASAEAWSDIIKQAAKAMKVDLSTSELSGIISQIHRESGGNQGITQSSAVVDINTLNGNPAKGLLQYIPQTFSAYALNGHKNIFSGYDQLLAFFNNSNWRRDLPYGKSGWGPSGSRRFTAINGSHKAGLPYVPFDGYTAQLHEGERVLTAAENKAYAATNGMNQFISTVKEMMSQTQAIVDNRELPPVNIHVNTDLDGETVAMNQFSYINGMLADESDRMAFFKGGS